MRYKPYPKYKESGVAWLGEVPEGWEIVQSKRLFEQRKERAKKGEEQLTASQKYGIISQKKFMELENRQVTQVIKGSEILKHIEPNDFVISMRSFQGGLEYSKQAGAVSSAYIGLIPIKHIHSKFFTYLFKSKPYIQALQSTSNLVRDGQALRFDNFSLVDLVIIPEEEQKKLADYLEEKTQKIDTLIAKQQTLIKLLKEKRQALISHAVTKGLDDTVEMKDSGVAWLGAVPEGWGVYHLKYAVDKIGDIDHYMPSSVSLGKPYLMTRDIKEKASLIDFSNCKQVSETDYLRLSKKIKPNIGDLIFARYATIGTISYVDIEKDFLVSYACVTIKPTSKKLSGKYLFYFFKSNYFFEEIKRYINSNTQGNIGIDSLYKSRVVIPPLAEQLKILSYLDQKTNQIDTLISKSTQAIELLKERRTALISAVVTGKIDIQNM